MTENTAFSAEVTKAKHQCASKTEGSQHPDSSAVYLLHNSNAEPALHAASHGGTEEKSFEKPAKKTCSGMCSNCKSKEDGTHSHHED